MNGTHRPVISDVDPTHRARAVECELSDDFALESVTQTVVSCSPTDASPRTVVVSSDLPEIGVLADEAKLLWFALGDQISILFDGR